MYLVGDGGEDAVVVVDAEGGVDVGQRVGPRPEEDAQRDVHVLQVLRARDRRNVLRPRSKIQRLPISQSAFLLKLYLYWHLGISNKPRQVLIGVA